MCISQTPDDGELKFITRRLFKSSVKLVQTPAGFLTATSKSLTKYGVTPGVPAGSV